MKKLSLLLALLFLPSIAFGQSIPRDDSGSIGWCTYIDDSVTPPIGRACSSLFPLPSGATSGAGGVPLGSGAAFFGGQKGNASGAVGPIPAITIFTPTGLLGLKQQGGSGLITYSSSDGGNTWSRGAALTGAGVSWNNPLQIKRTTSTSPRYVVSATGNGTTSIITAASFAGTWSLSTGIPANTNTGIAVQGAKVIAVGANGAATLTQACKSVDNGQTFSGCVTVDPAAGSIPTSIGGVPFVASPGPNIWIAALSNSKIWRSTDDGATWATVFTGSAGQGTVNCLTNLRCVVIQGVNVILSTDGGATFAQVGVLPSASGAVTTCAYNALTMAVVTVAPWPQSNGGVTQAAFKTTDGGVSFNPVNTTAGPAMDADPSAYSGECSVQGIRSSFVMFNASGSIYSWYGGPTGNGNIVIQSASRADACALGVTATGAAGGAVTATLPVASGQFHYICSWEIQQYASVAQVGAAAPIIVTSTNLPGSNAWTFQTALAIGTNERQMSTPGCCPVKSVVANTATTFVAPAIAGVIWRINVYYYAAP